MDLIRHLRFFLAVAEHRHFGHAADALHMTQPPVSQGVRRLETRLGQDLFDRNARRVVLTDAGAALLPQARRLVDDADELVASTRAWKPHQAVRVGLVEDLGELLPDLVATVAAVVEQDEIEPRIAGSRDLVQALRAAEIDLAVVRHPVLADGLLAGDVHVVGGSAAGLAADDLPILVPPRRHHPAAHDQFVDALMRMGRSGDCIELPNETERAAWQAAGRGVRWAPGAGGGLPPLRFRVLQPPEGIARTGIDHQALALELDRALARHTSATR